MLDFRLSGKVVVLFFFVWIRVRYILPSHLSNVAAYCRSGALGTEHDSFNAARIVYCPYEDEVVSRSA